MHDAARVRRSEATGELERDPLHLGRREPGTIDHGPQGVPFQQLGDQEGHSVLLSQIVDRQHVGVLEGASGPRFLLEAPHPGGIVRCGHHLHRHAAAQLFVARHEHAAHAALPQLALEVVAAGEHRSCFQNARQDRRLRRGQRGFLRRCGRRRAIHRTLGADESAPCQIVEPGDDAGGDETRRGEPDQRPHRPSGQLEIVNDDVRELQGASGSHGIGSQRPEDAAPPQLAEDRRHFTWCAMTLSLIFAYVALGMIFFSTSSSLALYGRPSMIFFE